jgi:signal transduction histidine kinase
MAVGEVAPVRTDPQLFSVIVSNLIDNALKYCATDALVEVRIDSALQRGIPGVLVEVSNLSGPAGMPDPRKVFRKYYRAPGAHGKIGSGLGLHIAAGFAKKLGGRLRYLPTDEKVKFTLWIPA